MIRFDIDKFAFNIKGVSLKTKWCVACEGEVVMVEAGVMSARFTVDDGVPNAVILNHYRNGFGLQEFEVGKNIVNLGGGRRVKIEVERIHTYSDFEFFTKNLLEIHRERKSLLD